MPRAFSSPARRYSSGRRRLEHRQHRWTLHHRSSNAFEMSANAAHFRGDKSVHEFEVAIEPREELVLDFVMHRERYFGAVGPNFREIHDAHQIDIAAGRFERELIGVIAFGGKQDRAGLEAQGAAKAEIDRLGRGHSRFRHHEKLPAIRLDTGEAGFAFRE